MRSGQRELSLVMIELGRDPGGRRMTFGAIVTESVSDVIGIGIVVIVVGMARVAIRRNICIAASMTLDTIHCYMCPGQRELRLRMVECRRRPTPGGMAKSAVGIEVICDMVGR